MTYFAIGLFVGVAISLFAIYFERVIYFCEQWLLNVYFSYRAIIVWLLKKTSSIYRSAVEELIIANENSYRRYTRLISKEEDERLFNAKIAANDRINILEENAMKFRWPKREI